MARKAPTSPDDVRMTLGEHLEELRWRILYALIGLAIGVGVTLAFTQPLIRVLRVPYAEAMTKAGFEPELTVVNVTAGFATFLRVGLIGGLILSAPWIFYQMWMFIGAGLYPHERRPILLAVPFSAALFIGGALFFLFVISRPTLQFFIYFNQWMGLRPIITLDNHVKFMTNLMFIFGVSFQMPVVLMILARTGLVSVARMTRYRRHVVVGILIVAMLFTSPSPVDQIGLAVPMYLLFELGVLLALLGERRRERAEAEE